MNNLSNTIIFWAEVSCSTYIVKANPGLHPKIATAFHRAGLSKIGTSLYHGVMSQEGFLPLVDSLNELASGHEAECFIFQVRDQKAPHWTTLIDTGVEH